MLVELYWDGGEKEEYYWFDIKEIDKKKVRGLVEDYKKTDENYNIDDLLIFLKEKGYKVKETCLSADVSIYF